MRTQAYDFQIQGPPHVNSNFCNLSLASPYDGSDKVTTANGSSMDILQIGSSFFTCKGKKIHLKNLLDIPTLSKNLLSVQIFCKDNDVSFEFLRFW